MSDTIEFLSFHIPEIKLGDYELTVKQETPFKTFTTTRQFHVAGERFSLQSQDIAAVFPPDGSLGDHSNVLPHVILNRSTLPWERVAQADSQAPWLALLVFDEENAPPLQTLTLGTINSGDGKLPAITKESTQKDSDPVAVIDVSASLLTDILPSCDDLPYLAHVRRAGDEENAVVIANRLPAAGKTSVVHLVSLENRFAGGQFDFQNAQKVRLVSLMNWRFACVDESHSFAAMVRQLTRHHQAYRLPTSSNAVAEDFLKEGYIPVRHAMRNGEKTAAWYRGPFVTGQIEDTLALPAKASDSLLQYNAGIGMFDVSYAAAWELGRLMALKSTSFSTALYDWKRRRDQSYKMESRDTTHPLQAKQINATMPTDVEEWLLSLARLDGIPFSYIVPEADLLPVESIRFFWLDPNWIRSLLDGAYSIGRITSMDYELDAMQSLIMPYEAPTGCLIRSDVISGYPGLLIDAYADTAGTKPLNIIRKSYLAKDILLLLVEGNLTRLDIHQKPEMLHFAVEMLDETQFQKTMRTNNAEAIDTLQTMRRISITSLVGKMKTALGQQAALQSGDFAYEMIETAERVSFYRG